ncbi:MAG: alanine--tRNA ligase [Tepidisphaeraceae bacterium]
MSTANHLEADTLRSKYLKFFAERGHAVIPSASLIPDNDPSVLFTTAGMHPLIPYLMGRPHPAGVRLADVQKCIRTSDIEEVGDATHLTFFEMLGNWSLGDYFKKESITWSHEFLTKAEWLNIPAERLFVSVFEGNADSPRDDESADIWRGLGFPDSRISYLPAKDNWWAVGDEGPCGPDTEIFYDITQTPCSAPECKPGKCDCGRFVEIWNNVFMAYNRTAGKVEKLPAQNVDTGMGLERTLAVLNGVPTVYETTSFLPIITALATAAGKSTADIAADTKLTRAIRVCADHLRTSVFVLGDTKAVTPSNQGAGYVLRRIIRRAIRFCDALGLTPTQWVETAQVVIDAYGHAYPELKEHAERVTSELTREREQFEKTLRKGTQLLDQEIAKVKAANVAIIPGDVAFHLYDTYGFPIEMTRELATEQGLSVDMDEYNKQFDAHRAKSKADGAAKSGLADTSAEAVRYHTATHLLHSALRTVLGTHVAQKGSNITAERMRFDFSHPKAMTKEEIAQVQQMVQDAIDKQIPVTREVMTFPEAKAAGAIGLFEDRYGHDVSVYTIGDASKEVCAGPHVANTSEIGTFKIEKEQSASSGVRRIRATIS